MGQQAARCPSRRESDDPGGADYRADRRRSNADPQPSPGRTTAHHDTYRHCPPALDPDGDCACYSDAATNSRFHPNSYRDANPDTHAYTYHDANSDTTAVANQSNIEPDTCRSNHVRTNQRGGGESHARVRDADAFPDRDADTHADARSVYDRDAHSRVDTGDLDADTNCDAQSHTHPARDHDTVSDQRPYRDPDSNGHTNPYAYADRDSHPVSNGDGYSRSYRHSDSDFIDSYGNLFRSSSLGRAYRRFGTGGNRTGS